MRLYHPFKFKGDHERKQDIISNSFQKSNFNPCLRGNEEGWMWWHTSVTLATQEAGIGR
jgi:hypothetical protein